APEKGKNAAANAAEVMGGGRCSRMTRPGRGQNRRQKRERALVSAPTCRSSATSNAKAQRRPSAESKPRCAHRTSRSAKALRLESPPLLLALADEVVE